MRNALLLLLTCCGAVGSSGCGMRLGAPIGAPRGVPYVSWVLMAGDRDNPDAEFVCQSDPRTTCTLVASRPGAQRWSTMYFYYHGVGEEIKYTGTIQIGFFEGPVSESHEVHPNIVVTHADIMPQSILDDVTATPGTYAVTIDVIATTRAGTIQPLKDTVWVVVK